MRKVRCQSGLMGERCFIQEHYTDFEDFKYYDDLYAICDRLGYPSDCAKKVWQWNPVIEKSVNPSDLRLVYLSQGMIQRKNGAIVKVFNRKKY